MSWRDRTGLSQLRAIAYMKRVLLYYTVKQGEQDDRGADTVLLSLIILRKTQSHASIALYVLEGHTIHSFC